MTAQPGKAVLLKRGTGSGSPEVFETIGGLRSKSIALNAETIDVTNADSANQWRELLSGGGIKSASLSGAGIFKDTVADAAVRQAFFDQAADNWQVIIPDFGTIEGPFQITALEYAGQHNDAATFSMTLESAGELSFTAL